MQKMDDGADRHDYDDGVHGDIGPLFKVFNKFLRFLQQHLQTYKSLNPFSISMFKIAFVNFLLLCREHRFQTIPKLAIK